MQGDLGQVKYTGIVATGRSLATEYGLVQGLFKARHLPAVTCQPSLASRHLPAEIRPDPVETP